MVFLGRRVEAKVFFLKGRKSPPVEKIWGKGTCGRAGGEKANAAYMHTSGGALATQGRAQEETRGRERKGTEHLLCRRRSHREAQAQSRYGAHL